MTSAAAISGALRRLGFNPLGSGTSYDRQGLRVKGSSLGKVRVVADLDSDRQAHDLAVAARMALVGAGYALEVPEEGAAWFYVTGRAS